ncbi:MAG TPA: Ig-like domain-containing protein, partial [Candidatus Saccharimonadales bacterium]|nr:Ig-like domain-containing protein [Candidatus Saccharimonadales bacterium]
LDAQGEFISEMTLSGKGRIMALAIDGPRNCIWITRDHTIERYSDTGDLIFRIAVPLDGSSALLAADIQGGAWLASQHQLAHINATGAADFVFTPFVKGRIDGLVADPLTGDVWVAGKGELKQYGLDSRLLREVALTSHKPVKSLAFYADTFPPTVRITAPKADSYTNDNTPAIGLKYSDIGAGVDTGAIKILANDQTLDLDCNSQAGDATCTPDAAIPDGAIVLKATVKDYAGNVSNTGKLDFTVDTVPPRINTATPEYTNQPDFVLTGTLSERSALTINGHAVSVAGDLSFSYAPGFKEGANDLHLVAVDLAGNRTLLDRTVVVDTVPPAVPVGMLVSAGPDEDGKVTLRGQSGSVEADVTVLVVNLRMGETASATADANGAFVAQAAGRRGDVYKITLSDRAGNDSDAIYMTAGDPTLDLHINSPTDGAKVADPNVTVTGTLSGPDNTGVTVNGVTADVVNGRFVAAGVPLDKGPNAIAVTAETGGGLTVTRGISVNSDGIVPALSLQADPAAAVAPANIDFDYAYRDPESVAQISYDFNGDGRADYTAAPTDQPVEHAYEVPGVYSVGLTVTNKDGSQHHAEQTVVIEDATVIDAAVRRTWTGLNWALKIGDKGAAMHYLDYTAQNKYGPVFDALLPYMPNIIGSYSPLAQASVASDFSEYAIRRTSNGQDRLFFIDFIKDGDGVWRLDSM